MATGTVKWFNAQKGYGFIAPNDGSKDVFVHVSPSSAPGFRPSPRVRPLTFDLERGQQGKTSAANLQVG